MRTRIIALALLGFVSLSDNLNIPRYVEPKSDGQVVMVEEAMKQLLASAGGD